MNRAACALALLVATSAAADVDPAFAKLRDAAEPIGSLGDFLTKYVGECGELLADKKCAEKAKAFRASVAGKKFYMIVSEDSATMVSAGPWDVARGDFTLNLVPFFPAGEYALTDGAPKKTDADGNPILPLIRIPGKAQEGWNQATVGRMVSTRQVRLQVVFTPQDVWTLPKKGGGKLAGVRAKLNGVLITRGRTGDQMGLWLGK
ncbi:MAG TPA: DUF6066 family protein [Myxococcaceae bacterium]|nr:DUF6066 family protein [Myxococcaceae bacterium]